MTNEGFETIGQDSDAVLPLKIHIKNNQDLMPLTPPSGFVK